MSPSAIPTRQPRQPLASGPSAREFSPSCVEAAVSPLTPQYVPGLLAAFLHSDTLATAKIISRAAAKTLLQRADSSAPGAIKPATIYASPMVSTCHKLGQCYLSSEACCSNINLAITASKKARICRVSAVLDLEKATGYNCSIEGAEQVVDLARNRRKIQKILHL